jgi:hypothetical protein
VVSTRSATVGDRYELLRRVGDTRSSDVWEAYDQRLDRTVELRIASGEDRAAQQQLRASLRQPRLGDQPDAPRVLDGGEDARYGTFLVTELNDRNAATRPLQPVVERPTYVPKRRGDPQVGALVLVPLVVGILLLIVFVARAAFAPVNQPGVAQSLVATPAPPARPLSGARGDQPAPAPTAIPTLAAATQLGAAPAASAPTVAPTAQAASRTGSPVDTIRQHYALMNAKNYAAGYQLMDSHLQSLNSPSDYAGWFANKVAIQLISVDLVSQSDTEAVVRSVVSSTDRVNGQDLTTQVSEQFVLKNENGTWRIDQVTRLS